MVGIYYIATGQYASFAEGFLNSLPNFWPSVKKHVRLMGDKSLEQFIGSRDGMDIDFVEVTHFPWPTITTYKFYLMKQNKIEGVTHHFYFNANIIFQNVDYDWSAFRDKIVVSHHSLSAFISTKEYMMGGAICLPEPLFDKFCDEHVKRVNYYLQENFAIPRWHDETILNEMLVYDKVFEYEYFPHECGFRWLYSDGSRDPQQGLCYISNDKTKQSLNKEKKITSYKPQIRVAFNLWQTLSPENFKNTLLYRILNKYYDVAIDNKNPHLLFYSVFDNITPQRYNCTKIKFVGEYNRFDPNAEYEIGMDYDRALVSNKYFYMPLYLLMNTFEDCSCVQTKIPEDFCCFLVSNCACSERVEFFKKLNEYRHVNSGGCISNNIGYRVPPNETNDFFRKHKYSISFENCQQNGYLTEKIFRSLYNGCIPIYWGDPLVENIINPKRFINANKLSFEEVVARIEEIEADDNLYKQIISEPILNDNQYWSKLASKFEKYLINITNNIVPIR